MYSSTLVEQSPLEQQLELEQFGQQHAPTLFMLTYGRVEG
jgi:hypothetical protein